MDLQDIGLRIRGLLKKIAGQPLFTFVPTSAELAKDVFCVAPSLGLIDERELYLQALQDALQFANTLVADSEWVVSPFLHFPLIRIEYVLDRMEIMVQEQGIEGRVRMDRALSLFEEGGERLLVVLLLLSAYDENCELIYRALMERAPAKLEEDAPKGCLAH